MNRWISATSVVLTWACSTVGLATSSAQDAAAVQDRVGLRRGLCIVLGTPELALALARQDGITVYAQSPDSDDVEALREAADEAGLLGSRLTVGHGSWSHLSMASDLADVVVVSESVTNQVARAEVLRVLRPQGTALVGDEVLVKPFPPHIDDWSHPYHGPDNNPQSQDLVARAPYLTHFLAEPWYGPMPLVTVASGGRLFKAFGHIAIKEREWPLLSTLICQNAFNGTILWQRKLSPSFMIHRNTMIATAETLYLADDVSCKKLDAATGELRGEIVAPPGDGPVWKWMALVDGTLFALVGQPEAADPTVRGDRKARGWPWGGPLGQGYNSKTYPWGFGHTLLAIDLATERIVWRHHETEPLDARGMCLAAGRLFFYSHGKFLGCLDSRQGSVVWKTSDPDVLQAIGQHKFAQNPKEGFSSSAFIKANAQALYFAGPTRADLVAVSAVDGRLLWKQANGGNSQLVLRHDGLYAMSPEKSSKYDFLSGKILADLGPRVNCTRATGSVDSIFVRGGRDGTIRYDLTSSSIDQQHLCPMRPSCQDGVIPAFGHLYWGPWMCDCNLTLVGVVSLAPAGEFNFAGDIHDPERREQAPRARQNRPSTNLVEVTASDWPTLRANNRRNAYSPVRVAGSPELLWTYRPTTSAAASVSAAGPFVYIAGRDGGVRALDAQTGMSRWSARTGGAIRYPVSLADGKAYVGSADGWIYCLDAATGAQVWRFRAAPAERMIPVYGSLSSSWPVASGVLVEQGVAYAAAGIANHDGTHVLALNAQDGSVLWHNANSGAMHPETSAGVSVNGHLLLAKDHLYLAGGNMVPVASYRARDGQCVTDPSAPPSHTQFKAGSDLFLVGEQVQAGGSPLYSSPGDYRMVNQALLQTPAGDLVIAYGPHDSRVAWHAAGTGTASPAQPVWTQNPLNRIAAVAVTPDAVIVAGHQDAATAGAAPTSFVMALRTADGGTAWRHELPAMPSIWGTLVDRQGRIVVALEDGRVLSFGTR
ncbi:MAG: PQQ-binding-like beta-propeller repeat protein [Pirellulaceae bacterium]